MYAHYTQHLQHKHLAPESVLNDWAEVDGVKYRSSIFTKVEHTSDYKKVRIDGSCLHGVDLEFAIGQYIPVGSLWIKRDLEDTYKTLETCN